VDAWIPIQAEPQAFARASRLGAEEIPYVHLCERLLLARTQVQPHPRPLSKRRGENGFREFGVLQDSEDEQGVLGGEDSQEQRA